MTVHNSVSLPVGGAIPDTTQLGGAPRDGDFARLLDAASQPAAHRLHRTLQNLPQAHGSLVATGRAGASAQNTAFGHGSSMGHGASVEHGHGAGQGAGASQGGLIAAPSTLRTAEHHSTQGASGAQTDDATALALQAGASTLAAGTTAIKRWSDKPPRDRFISALFVLAALWIGISIFGQLINQFDEHAGLLIVLAIGAFIFFSRRSQRRRTQT
jgi:hypothetical protein